MITARCGRTDLHGGHVFPKDGGTKSAFCAGNQNVIVAVEATHMGRDWAGRLMACTIPGAHRGRKHIGAHGGTLRIER